MDRKDRWTDGQMDRWTEGTSDCKVKDLVGLNLVDLDTVDSLSAECNCQTYWCGLS